MRWGSVVLVLVVATMVMAAVRLTHRDAAFCRQVLRDLVSSRLSVGRSIDWEHLNALELNVGETYRQLPNAEERQRYQMAFVENFSKAFRDAQGDVDAFGRWRILEREGNTTRVAADYLTANRTLVLTIADIGWGRQRIEALQWQ